MEGLDFSLTDVHIAAIHHIKQTTHHFSFLGIKRFPMLLLLNRPHFHSLFHSLRCTMPKGPSFP